MWLRWGPCNAEGGGKWGTGSVGTGSVGTGSVGTGSVGKGSGGKGSGEREVGQTGVEEQGWRKGMGELGMRSGRTGSGEMGSVGEWGWRKGMGELEVRGTGMGKVGWAGPHVEPCSVKLSNRINQRTASNCCTASEVAVHISYTGTILIHLTAPFAILDHTASHTFNHNALQHSDFIMTCSELIILSCMQSSSQLECKLFLEIVILGSLPKVWLKKHSNRYPLILHLQLSLHSFASCQRRSP